MAETKLLIHISDRDKWNSIFSLISRMKENEDEKELKVIIIADVFAGAVCIACNQSLKQQMVDFVSRGQQIVVCEESIRCLNIPLKSLPDFAQTVPVALSEISKLLEMGFQYIKI